ncbi:MAG: Phosphate-binding protein [Candidatus Hydrogenedentes bacterium]|nr:Phosphate-binding protein [Candidatus Hydrogenedentota bacterium]
MTLKFSGRAVQLLLAATIIAAAFASGCSGGQSSAVNVVGSTSVQPFAELLAEEYARENPEENIEVQGGGSTAGLQAASNGLADIGMCSRALKPEEAEQFTGIVIARDGLAFVVNPANPVQSLTTDQLRGLFDGSIANWKEVGGDEGPVRPITREEGSGTRESFVKLVMGESRISRRALTQESNGAVKELVKGDPAAIGYMSLGLVGHDLKAVLVDGVEPTVQNVLAGGYHLTRPFLFVTKGTAVPGAQRFIDYVLSPVGQAALKTEGLVPIQ